MRSTTTRKTSKSLTVTAKPKHLFPGDLVEFFRPHTEFSDDRQHLRGLLFIVSRIKQGNEWNITFMNSNLDFYTERAGDDSVMCFEFIQHAHTVCK